MRPLLFFVTRWTWFFLLAVSAPAQVQTAHSYTPTGAASSLRGPAGAEELMWAQLGHSASMNHILNQMELDRLRSTRAADEGLAAGTFHPDLTGPVSPTVFASIAAAIKAQDAAFRPYPLLEQVWSGPPQQAIESYLRDQYDAYVATIRARGDDPENVATACAFLVETEYRVTDPQHRNPNTLSQTGIRGTCIASIARLEKAETLSGAAARGELAQSLATVGAAYNERLRYAQSRSDTEAGRQLMAFVNMDFGKLFGFSPQQLPPLRFPCLLLDSPEQCTAGLPKLQELLTQVVARNK